MSFRKTKLYLSWANSILKERHQAPVNDIMKLRDGEILVLILDILWPDAKIRRRIEDNPSSSKVEVLLQYLRSTGLQLDVSATDVAEGSPGSLNTLLWTIILHFNIHTPRITAFQRNHKAGVRSVLNWLRDELPEVTINHLAPLVENVARECVLIDLIEKHVSPVPAHHPDTTERLTRCMVAAEKQLGVSADLFQPLALLKRTVDEEALLIYMALLRRKINNKGASALTRSAPGSATALDQALNQALRPSATGSFSPYMHLTRGFRMYPRGVNPAWQTW